MSSSSFRALKNYNYRAYFLGQLASNMGSWTQSLVLGWVVYRISGSAAWLGLISFASQMTAFTLSPFAGVMADTWPRRRALFWIEAAGILQATSLAALTYFGLLRLDFLMISGVLLGAIQAFQLPFRHALALDMVGRADLPSAIALNSLVVNGSRVLGPALAAVLLGPLGEAGCFMFNAISTIAILVGLAVIKLPEKTAALSHLSLRSFFKQFIETQTCLKQTPGVPLLLFVATFFSFVGFPFTVVFPVIAKVVLGGGIHTLVWLTSANGVGAVVGALTMGRMGPSAEKKTERVLFRNIFLLGVALGVLSISKVLWLTVPATFLVGYSMMGSFPRINNAIQNRTPDALRGRILSAYTMTFLGAMPLGSLGVGWLVDHFGVAPIAAMSSFICIALASTLIYLYSKRQPGVQTQYG
ncbi:MFS transporter [Bdellovibrionota bacterium FG-2]